jgi:hypothetical protein
MEFGFSLILAVLTGVSQAAPYLNLTVAVGVVHEKEQMEHKNGYVFLTI